MLVSHLSLICADSTSTCVCVACVCLVKVKLAEQTDIAIEASSRAEQLEEDLAGLRAQVAQVSRAFLGGSCFCSAVLVAFTAE